RLIQAMNASQELQDAQAMLEQTSSIQMHLERWGRLETIDQARTQQWSLQRDLAERLDPLLTERETLQQAITVDEAALKVIQTELNRQERTRELLEQQQLQTEERIEWLEQRLVTVRHLGPDGVCETCGQSFGATMENVLAHYAEERDAARQEA